MTSPPATPTTAPPSPFRVRFAPSPTGMLHVGNARTALFNWLFARSTGATNLLRIEDTDASRGHPDWVELIYRSLEWLGLDWDGDPSFQSASMAHHRDTALKLHADGLAYYCDCTPEDLDARKKAAGIKTPGYDSFCSDRDLPPGEGRALRFRVPDEGTLHRVDVVRGESDIELATIEDFVILRANGLPLYAFANTLDDVQDGITHVLRGEDHLSNVPKQILIRQALGHPEPVWVHLPMIVNDQRRKLSKRRDKLALAAYQSDGILSEAMVNYLATLGWSPPGEDELATLDEMVAAFRLEDLSKAPAAFDLKKLHSFNGHYLRALPPEEFVDRTLDWYRTTIVEPMATLIQERGATFPETLSMTDFFLHDVPPMDVAAWEKVMVKGAEAARSVLGAAIAGFDAEDLDWTSAEAVKGVVDGIVESLGSSVRKVQEPIRVAVTGRTVGPPLWESLVVLGKHRTIERLVRALDKLPPPA